MRAAELKKKYPEMWEAVSDSVIKDFRSAKLAGTIAHNAAFVACEEHHRMMKVKKMKEGE